MSLTVLDRINLSRIWLKTAWREYHRFRQNRISGKKAGIRVFYGFDKIPAAGEKAYGGIIKVQDLQKAFPNDPRQANVLYLVSSALPEFPVRMVKLARQAGVKVVLNQNGVAYPGWYGKGWQQANGPMQKILHMSDHVVYQSAFCKQAADRFLGPRVGAADILYNPVDTAFFSPAVDQPTEKTEDVNLLLAGSHQSFYRVRAAVEALRLVLEQAPGTRLIIAGRCSWEREEKKAVRQLQECIAEMHLEAQVKVMGPYSQLVAPALFQQADILIHTKYNDPCPRLVVEGMACGLPVVYSATGGVPELVGNEAGRGVPGPLDWEQDHPPDPAALAEQVVLVMSDLSEYSRAARNRAVNHFDVQPWLKRHGEIFARVLAG